jgi:hypothetical protein
VDGYLATKYLPLDPGDDGLTDDLDSCPEVFNPIQEDGNSSGIGDACEFPDTLRVIALADLIQPGGGHYGWRP